MTPDQAMTPVRKCRLCGLVTHFQFCSCRGVTKQVLPHRIAGELYVDVTLNLRYHEGRKQYVLVIEKPSGQQIIALQAQDMMHR